MIDLHNGSNGWDHTGWRAEGRYLDRFPFKGKIESSRVKHGGKVQHTIVLDSPLQVFGAVRGRILMIHEEVEVSLPSTITTASSP